MTHEERLILVLALIYAYECLHWVNARVVALRRWSFGKFEVVSPSTFLLNGESGFFFLDPLPFGAIYGCDPMPLFVSEDGIAFQDRSGSDSAQRNPGERIVIPFDDENQSDEYEMDLRIDRLFRSISFDDDAYAIHLRHFLRLVSKSAKSNRTKLVRNELARSLDTEEISGILAIYSKRSMLLRRLCQCAFVWICIVLPWAALTHRLSVAWPILLGTQLMLTVGIANQFLAFHKLYYPDRSRERITRLISMVTIPPVLIKSADYLTMRLFSSHHPFALAYVLCEPSAFRAYAQSVLADSKCFTEYRHPDEAAEPDQASYHRIVRDFERLRLSVFEEFLETRGIPPAELYRPPMRDCPENLSFCPRCRQQFVKPEGDCHSCGGIPLVPF